MKKIIASILICSTIMSAAACARTTESTTTQASSRETTETTMETTLESTSTSEATSESTSESTSSSKESSEPSNASVESLAPGSVKIRSDQFPDSQFLQYVSKNCDPDRDGILAEEEISQVKVIDLGLYSVDSVDGISCFTNLEELYWNNWSVNQSRRDLDN